MKGKITILLFFLVSITGFAQEPSGDRIDKIRARLIEISANSPGLNEVVDFSVTGVSIQEFLRGLAETNNLNISVDPSLDIKVYNNFTNEKVSNIIVFICEEYGLDIHFIGSIMSFYKYKAPEAPKVALPPREIKISYNKPDSLITMELRRDTLLQIIKKITSLTGANIILSPKIDKNTPVSLYIKDAKLEPALEKLAYASSLNMRVSDDGFFIFEPVLEGEEDNNNSRYNNRRSRGNSGSKLSEEFFYEIVNVNGEKKIILEATDVPIKDVIITISREIQQDYFLFSDPKGNTSSYLSKVSYEDFLAHVLRGTEHTFKVDKNIYLIGEEKLEGLRATRVINLEYRSYTDVIRIIPAELKKGVEIQEFEELNSIVLSGSEPQIIEIEKFIHRIDQLVPLIMIEVILVDIKKGSMIKTGVNAGLADSSVSTGGTLLPGLDFVLSSSSINKTIAPFNLGQVNQNFYLSLQALEQSNNAKIKSMPKLSTLNGHEATLSIGQTRYYSIQTQNTVGSLNPNTITTQQYNSVNADLSIRIKPVVSGSDFVTLEIDVSNSDFIGAPPDNQPPPTSTSQFTSLIRVRDNDMVILGGLERSEESESRSGIPLLSKIPILKWFFSSKSTSKGKSISVVFIKPTIIH